MVADAALRRIAGRLAALQHAPGLAGSADAGGLARVAGAARSPRSTRGAAAARRSRRPIADGRLAGADRPPDRADGRRAARRQQRRHQQRRAPNGGHEQEHLAAQPRRRAGRTARSAPPVGAEKPSEASTVCASPARAGGSVRSTSMRGEVLAGEGRGVQQLDAAPAAAPTVVNAVTVQRSMQARGGDRGQPRRAEPFDQPRGPRRTARSRR